MNMKKKISYLFNRLRYKFLWFVRKWFTHGDCRHICCFCKYHDVCLMNIMDIFRHGNTHADHFK